MLKLTMELAEIPPSSKDFGFPFCKIMNDAALEHFLALNTEDAVNCIEEIRNNANLLLLNVPSESQLIRQIINLTDTLIGRTKLIL